MDTRALAVVCTIGEMRKTAQTALPPPTAAVQPFRGFEHMVHTSYNDLVEAAMRQNGLATARPGLGGVAQRASEVAGRAGSSMMAWLERVGPEFSAAIRRHPMASAIIGGALGALILRKLFD